MKDSYYFLYIPYSIYSQKNNVVEVWMPEEKEPAIEGKKHPSRISLAFYFGIAYASTIGGCGTLIGTGTNLTFKGLFEG